MKIKEKYLNRKFEFIHNTVFFLSALAIGWWAYSTGFDFGHLYDKIYPILSEIIPSLKKGMSSFPEHVETTPSSVREGVPITTSHQEPRLFDDIILFLETIMPILAPIVTYFLYKREKKEKQ